TIARHLASGIQPLNHSDYKQPCCNAPFQCQVRISVKVDTQPITHPPVIIRPCDLDVTAPVVTLSIWLNLCVVGGYAPMVVQHGNSCDCPRVCIGESFSNRIPVGVK